MHIIEEQQILIGVRRLFQTSWESLGVVFGLGEPFCLFSLASLIASKRPSSCVAALTLSPFSSASIAG